MLALLFLRNRITLLSLMAETVEEGQCRSDQQTAG
jgi:hypothetical protein